MSKPAPSLSTEEAIGQFGYTLWPREFSTFAYRFMLSQPERIVRAYGVSTFVTVVGTALGLLITAMMAYALSRPAFKIRQWVALYLYFPTLFGAGMIPFYLFVTQNLGLKNNIWVMILPSLVNSFSVLLVRTYFSELPKELIEAAKIDGASEWRILFQVVLPLSTPILATVGLLMALSYWNSYYLALLFIDDTKLYPLQLLLYNIQAGAQLFAERPEAQQFGIQIPVLTARMAAALIAIGPIALIYLFFQKYLIRGITVGATKG